MVLLFRQSISGEPDDTETVTSGSERRGWKSASMPGQLAGLLLYGSSGFVEAPRSNLRWYPSAEVIPRFYPISPLRARGGATGKTLSRLKGCAKARR